jgi:hypothetical protein
MSHSLTMEFPTLRWVSSAGHSTQLGNVRTLAVHGSRETSLVEGCAPTEHGANIRV